MHASNLLIMLVCTHCLAVCACVCALKRPSVCMYVSLCVCVCVPALNQINYEPHCHSRPSSSSPFSLMASARRLLRRLLLHYVRPLVCLLLLLLLVLPFSTCFQLRCPQCASLKTIGHIHCVPSSSLHAHDINMAEFACMAGRQVCRLLSS